jgi:hypothetical protein
MLDDGLIAPDKVPSYFGCIDLIAAATAAVQFPVEVHLFVVVFV